MYVNVCTNVCVLCAVVGHNQETATSSQLTILLIVTSVHDQQLDWP